MANYIEINDLGNFADINALWAAHPEGGHEGDYCTISGVKYRWDKYDRMWVADPNYGPTPARKVDTFNGDVNIQNNLTVAGTIRAKGINNPCVGYFATEEALEEKWPYPKVGWWAIVGETIPGIIYSCDSEGEWTNTGHEGGAGEVDLTEYAKLIDVPEIIDNLDSDRGDKALSAKQGKILNEKFPAFKTEIMEQVNQAVESIEPIVIEGDVTNSADEEDLTSVDTGSGEVLKLKDKAYSPLTYSGLGRKYLRKNMVGGVNKLTQAMIADANTIYSIQYDYDLDGATITLPAGATLKFEGGSLKNGTITGNGTVIDAGNTKIFDSITFSGSFKGSLNALWVGAKSKDSSFDNSPILQAWFDNYSDYFRVIEFPLDNYYFLTPVVKNDEDRYKEIRGNNSNFYVNIADDGDKGQYFLTIRGENFTLKDVSIRNSRKTTIGSTNYDLTKTRCLYLKQAQLFSLSGVTIMYFDVGVYIEDIWYGGFSGMNALANNRIGVLAIGVTSQEVNTIDFRNLRLRGVSVATAQAVWSQNDGESDADYAMRTASVALDFHCISNNCKFDSVTMEGFDYGIRFNYIERSSGNGSMHGVANITKCYFEANRVYDIYTGRGWVIRDRGYSYSLYTLMTLLIDSCLFHTLKKCYFRDAFVTMIGCHEQCEVQLSNLQSGCNLVHDGSAICTGENPDYSTRIGLYDGGWDVNGYTGYQSNLQAKLENSEGDRTLLRPYINPYRLNQTYSQNTSAFTVGSVVQRTFNMYPSAGMQGIIQPLRCYYDAQKNALFAEVTSGGTKRMAYLYYLYAMRVLGGGKTNTIPLFEFFRRWDNGTTYTGEVGHLFPFTITANPSTGLITNSSGTIVGFGKKALIDGTFNPSDIGRWIDVDSMCVVRYSYSRLKWSCDLVQCARSYLEILPNEDSSASATTRLYKGTTTQRDSNVRPHVNAIYFNTDKQNYQIFNGTKWVTLDARYQRYEYVSHGATLLDRPKVADFPDQTFTDDSTGITYIFKINDAKTSYSWVNMSDKRGTTDNRPSLSWDEDGYKYYDTTIRRNIYSKIGKTAEVTQVIPAGSQSTAQTVTINNTLVEGQRYWCGYAIKHSWGGSVSFRKTADSSEGQIVVLSNFNSNDKGTYFTAPSPTEYPYIYMSNYYGAAETVTFEVPSTSWIEDDGATAGVKRNGATSERPASADIYVGFQYFDTTLGKVVVWDGTDWKNVDGSALS